MKSLGSRYLIWFLIIGIALGLRVPGVFTQDEKEIGSFFEPDEIQHVEIAIAQIQRMDKKLFQDVDVESKIFNVRGYGILTGVISYGLHLGFQMELSNNNFILVAKFLSILFSIFLIFLVYNISYYFFQSDNIALLSAFLIGIFDLNVTYSHYGIPAISYVFWTYLSVFLLARLFFLLQKNPDFNGLNLKKFPKSILIGLPFAASMAFAYKFDFIPFCLFFPVVLYALIVKKISFKNAVLTTIVFIILVAGFFQIGTFGGFQYKEAIDSFTSLYAMNKDIIKVDNHYLHNPILYFLGTIGGTSIWMILLAIIGLPILLKNSIYHRKGIAIFIALLVLEFLVRWNIDTPFIRRVNIFLPFIAIVAAYMMIKFLQYDKFSSLWIRKLLVISVVVYTFVLTIVSQSNFWNDTRYQARVFINDNIDTWEVMYSPFSYVQGMRNGIREAWWWDAKYIVIHETYYGRYWKYFTTPFTMPECCNGVFHCHGEKECAFYQSLLAGKEEDFELMKAFPTIEIMPERILYKKLFGSYETFLGDLLIYKRVRDKNGNPIE